MKKRIIALIILILFSFGLYANPIKKNLKEIKKSEKLLKSKLKEYHKTIRFLEQKDPLFHSQKKFESNDDFFKRRTLCMEEIHKLKINILGNLKQKLVKLRTKTFETSDISIRFDKYNISKEEYWITIKHKKYARETYQFSIPISAEKAKKLISHKESINIKGILTIDPDNSIKLTKIYVIEPFTGIQFEKEFLLIRDFEGNAPISLSNDGAYIAISRDNFITQIFDTKQEKLINLNVNSSILSFSNLHNYLASSNSRNGLQVFRKNFKPVREYNFKKEITDIIFSPDEKFILVADINNNLTIFQLPKFKKIKSFSYTKAVSEMNFSSDGRFLLVGSDTARLYDLLNDKEKKLFVRSKVKDSAFNIDNTQLITVSEDNIVRLFNLESGIIEHKISFRYNVNSVDFSKDGQYFIVGGDKIEIYSLKNYLNVWNLDIKATQVRFSELGQYIAIATKNNVYWMRTLLKPEMSLKNYKEIQDPPFLITSVEFSEPSGNRYLDALETASIIITIANSGKGASYGLDIEMKPNFIDGLIYNNIQIGKINPDCKKKVTIPIQSSINIKSKKHIIKLDFVEANGFSPPPVEIEFSTKEFNKPEIFINDFGVVDGNGNGKIESGEMIDLTIRLGNRGQGTGIDIITEFDNREDVFFTRKYPATTKISKFYPNETNDIHIEFFVNDRTLEKIPLYLNITDKYGFTDIENQRIPIQKSDWAKKIQRTVIVGLDENSFSSKAKELTVDVEKNIPEIEEKNQNLLAVVFGIEEYRNVSKVTFAHRDAAFIKEYFLKTFGVLGNKLYFKVDSEVTQGEFNKVFSNGGWLDKRVTPETKVLIYYAGHGIPSIQGNDTYLIPYDGDPNYPAQTGYSYSKLLDNLENLKAEDVILFLDTCFSGTDRENNLLVKNIRPVYIDIETPFRENITIFSATTSTQVSSAYPNKLHGLFTYFLMKGFQSHADFNKDSIISMNEIYLYVKARVEETASQNDREQTPQLQSRNPEKILLNLRNTVQN